jgi:nucleoside-diphosphate-sugar epimerase
MAITGASGYIGKHLLAELAHRKDRRIKILSRSENRNRLDGALEARAEVVTGDVLQRESFLKLIEPGCTVINLVYLPEAGESGNLAACENLLAACRTRRVRRLIHCSTASVVGRTSERVATETTPCEPISEYGVIKLKVERSILNAAENHVEATILRPTAVFGGGGENLRKLFGDLSGGGRWKNYLKSCLFGKRRMNLVCVENVVAALLFLADYEGDLGGQIFNVSDADSPLNNFADVERMFMREIFVPDYPLPRIPLPLSLLALLLNGLGKDIANPLCDFSSEKLTGLGFEKPVDFETALIAYAKSGASE